MVSLRRSGRVFFAIFFRSIWRQSLETRFIKKSNTSHQKFRDEGCVLETCLVCRQTCRKYQKKRKHFKK